MLLKPVVFTALLSGWGLTSDVYPGDGADNNATLSVSDITQQQSTNTLLDLMASPEFPSCKREKKRPAKKKGKGKEWDSSPGKAAPVSKGTGQQVALASYIDPSTNTELWDRMIKYPADKVSVLIANVLNGPDWKRNDGWASVISAAHNRGKTIIGYVRTGYLGNALQGENPMKTALGSTALADWLWQIQNDVETWYKLYPGKIGGIFFDEIWNGTTVVDAATYADYYRMLSDNTKRKHPGAFTVLNPGQAVEQSFEDSADTLMTFESNMTNYLDRTGDQYIPLKWVPKDNRKLWHIVYDVPEDKILEIAAVTRERHAGFVQITSVGMPNPYGSLPTESYMMTLMGAVQGGGPLIMPLNRTSGGPVGPKPSPPSNLRVTDAEYTSATLEWTISGNPEIIVLYRNNREEVRMPGNLTRVTVGNLPIDSKKNEFKIQAIDKGAESAFSNTVMAATKPIPEGKPITNIKATASANETIYEADVFLPYGFLRIFVTDPDFDCKNPAYPVNTDRGFVCAKYLIEGEAAYSYKDKGRDNETGLYPWSWDPIAPISSENSNGQNIEVGRTGKYHYVWRLPVGTSTMDTTTIVVEGEGINTRTDVYFPCPCHWKAVGIQKYVDKEKEGDEQGQRYCGAPKRSFCPYDCKESSRCSRDCRFSDVCDKAVKLIKRGKQIYRAADGQSELSGGGCKANLQGSGCSVTIQGKDKNSGKHCEITGDELVESYLKIRAPESGLCEKCPGSRSFENGCSVVVKSVKGCKNGRGGKRGNNRVENAADDFGEGQTWVNGAYYGGLNEELV